MDKKIDVSASACEERILKRNKRFKIFMTIVRTVLFACFIALLVYSIMGKGSIVLTIVSFLMFVTSFLPDNEPLLKYSDVDVIMCPRCGKTHITYHKKGFSVGKALIGATLLGIWGAFAGTIGSERITATCLSCGKRFKIKSK